MKYDTKALESRMQKAITAYENNLADVRASQANAGVLNRVTFDYYGAPTPISQVAEIRAADARTPGKAGGRSGAGQPGDRSASCPREADCPAQGPPEG